LRVNPQIFHGEDIPSPPLPPGGRALLFFPKRNPQIYISLSESFNTQLINRSQLKVPPRHRRKEKALSTWFSPRTPVTIAVPRIPQILASIEEIYGKKTWGAVGVQFPIFPFLSCSFS
jgi:hypothetical protein